MGLSGATPTGLEELNLEVHRGGTTWVGKPRTPESMSVTYQTSSPCFSAMSQATARPEGDVASSPEDLEELNLEVQELGVRRPVVETEYHPDVDVRVVVPVEPGA